MDNNMELSLNGRPEITIRYPDMNQVCGNNAPMIERNFTGEMARVLRELIDAGKFGVELASIPRKLIPRFFQNGFNIQTFSDRRYDPPGHDQRRHLWARLVCWDKMEILSGGVA